MLVDVAPMGRVHVLKRFFVCEVRFWDAFGPCLLTSLLWDAFMLLRKFLVCEVRFGDAFGPCLLTSLLWDAFMFYKTSVCVKFVFGMRSGRAC